MTSRVLSMHRAQTLSLDVLCSQLRRLVAAALAAQPCFHGVLRADVVLTKRICVISHVKRRLNASSSSLTCVPFRKANSAIISHYTSSGTNHHKLAESILNT